MTTIYKKLIDVQSELKAPKNQRNSFGKYNYRSAEDILEALKPVLKEHGATVFLKDAIKVNEALWTYVEATATFVDVETGESVEVTAFAREPEIKKGMDSSQVTGTASSYARKYALNGLFLIDDTKDADTDEHRNQTGGQSQGSNGKISKDDVISIRLDLVKISTATQKDVNGLESWLNSQVGVTNLASIPSNKVAAAKQLVQQLAEKAGI